MPPRSAKRTAAEADEVDDTVEATASASSAKRPRRAAAEPKAPCPWYDYETVLVRRFGAVAPSRKVAFFDFDDTLSESASGAKFPKGASDWKLYHPRVRPFCRHW